MPAWRVQIHYKRIPESIASTKTKRIMEILKRALLRNTIKKGVTKTAKPDATLDSTRELNKI